MAPEEQDKTFSAEADRSIKALSAMAERLRRVYARSGALPVDIASLFDADEALLYRSAMVTLFAELEFSYVLVGSGIPLGTSFGDEALRIIKAKILPYVYDERDLRLVARKVFRHHKDSEMLLAMSAAYGTEWLASEGSLLVPDTAILQNQLESATKILSYRIAAIGMEEEMAIRAGSDGALITPFLEQNREINELLASLDKDDRSKAAEDYAQAVVMLRQCKENIQRLDKAAAKNGASLQQTFILNKSSLLIDRLLIILPLLHEIEEHVKISGFFSLIRDMVILEVSPRKLRDFFSRNIQIIAYRITENKRKTGEHYITSGWAEYREMFVSASGGGFIVAFMVILKLMIHHGHFAPLWEGLLFSINYAAGFVLVQILGFTIATKQPAMTAAFIAASLDKAETDTDGYKDFGAMIAAVSRSQLASFAGNLLVVFPVTLSLIFLMNAAIGDYFLHEETAAQMIRGINPVLSLSILYAALAGFYLFLAGLISGFGDNKVMVSHIGLRLLHHPWLSKHISKPKLLKIAGYTERNIGPISGNIAVGFMLGITAFFGHITGLPLDIRHVTFSTGNFALALFGMHFHISGMQLFAALMGLFVIGLVNFLVSFSFALQIAIRSRGLRLHNYPDLARSVLKYFWRHPTDFFWPGREKKEDRVVEAIIDGPATISNNADTPKS
jgi:site-specific recombinase